MLDRFIVQHHSFDILKVPNQYIALGTFPDDDIEPTIITYKKTKVTSHTNESVYYDLSQKY